MSFALNFNAMRTIIATTILFFTVMQATAQGQQPTDKHFWYTLETQASPEAIWQVWTDVARWKDWDTGLKDAEMPAPFELHAKGTIISLEGRKSKFKVVEFEPGQMCTYKTKLPLGSLYVKRYLKQEGGKTTFTHEVWFAGLTKGIFAKAFGGKFRGMLPGVLQNIKAIAEQAQ